MYSKKLFLFFLLMLSGIPSAYSAKYSSRIDLGVFQATERFSDASTGSDKNDYFTGSFRYFTKVSEIGDSRWEFVSDIRDKNDFFGKLNKEQLQLDNANTFQLRRFSARWPNLERNWSWTLGRFPVGEAGSVYTDGVLTEYRWNPSWTTALFGGLNPKRVDQTYVRSNPDSNIGGFYATYQSRLLGWNQNLYLAHAYVTESVSGQTDRSYFFHNMTYQWQANSRLISLMYLDFVPHTYIQVGSLYYQQEFTNRFSTQLTILGVDVIEYTRRQGIRELLPSSPYKEAALKMDYRLTPLLTLQLGGISGQRDYDHLTKTEYNMGLFSNKTFGPKWDSYLKVGSRKNFASNDVFLRTGIAYFSRLWESELDIEGGSEEHTNGDNLHPLSVELAITKYSSKQLYYTLSAQRATDEKVTIYAGFLKIGYRFGNQEIPPIRDGAPPRGAL